jgi:hypothetical protein
MSAFRERAAVTQGEVLTFSDTEPLHALEAITLHRPKLVALERLFAATPRGTALINRIRADPALVDTEIRVLAHDSDYSRVLPRPARPAGPTAGMSPPASSPAVAAAAATTPKHETSAATLDAQSLDPTGTRRAPRIRIAANVDVLVDGNPATLVELSTYGAQVVSPTILKPNQRVRMALTDEGGLIRCNGTIAWAEFEIPRNAPSQYRAGIEFVDADAAAIDAFCARHRA